MRVSSSGSDFVKVDLEVVKEVTLSLTKEQKVKDSKSLQIMLNTCQPFTESFSFIHLKENDKSLILHCLVRNERFEV